MAIHYEESSRDASSVMGSSREWGWGQRGGGRGMLHGPARRLPRDFQTTRIHESINSILGTNSTTKLRTVFLPCSATSSPLSLVRVDWKAAFLKSAPLCSDARSPIDKHVQPRMSSCDNVSSRQTWRANMLLCAISEISNSKRPSACNDGVQGANACEGDRLKIATTFARGHASKLKHTSGHSRSIEAPVPVIATESCASKFSFRA